jgi:hypothetical protein
MADAVLDPPRERRCERCGRRDEWDDATGHWQVVAGDDGPLAGDPYCIHEWDVTAAYNPLDGHDDQ